MKKTVKVLTSIATSVSLVFLSSGITDAAQSADISFANVQEVEAALEQVAINNDSLIIESSVMPHESIGAISLGSGEVTIPENLNEGITLDSPDSSSITVTPAPSVEWEKAVPLDKGGVTYLSEDGFSESVIIGDGGVQMLTTINNASAPTEYEYEIDLEKGQILEFKDGVPAVFNADGSLAAFVERPWAIDAKGKPVSTHYEIAGDTLIQVVDHQALSSDSYPVVADPFIVPVWLLRCLVGMGINSASILQSAQMGSFWLTFGKAAFYCIRGR
ncbi:hypothetical protein [Canibacter zhoujuaniae]|uniref:hypothetical protein n=1 Tax=Canibacter zhoujuaniae TaxID=2708343 RepID=UPI0014201792|nr:hypothetical protein [Canibacter zhoujuaniae]